MQRKTFRRSEKLLPNFLWGKIQMSEPNLSECRTVAMLICAIANMHASPPQAIAQLLADYLWLQSETEVIMQIIDSIEIGMNNAQGI